MVPDWHRWNTNNVLFLSNTFSDFTSNTRVSVERNNILSSLTTTSNFDWMRIGEPIGRCFLEDLSLTHDSSIMIEFGQSEVSYSDGTNTYHLEVEDQFIQNNIIFYFLGPKVIISLCNI